MSNTAVMENIMRAALPGYGGSRGGGDPADVIRAYRTSTGAINLAKKQQKEELDMRKTELASRIKAIDAQIETAAAQLGLNKEQLAQRIKEFDVTTAATKERFDVNTAFNEKKFDWQKTQAKQVGAVGLATAGWGTQPQKETAMKDAYGISAIQTGAQPISGTTPIGGVGGGGTPAYDLRTAQRTGSYYRPNPIQPKRWIGGRYTYGH